MPIQKTRKLSQVSSPKAGRKAQLLALRLSARLTPDRAAAEAY
jgi:hypothetical protein